MGSSVTLYSQVVKGSRDLRLEFWDTSGKAGVRNFKFGIRIDHKGY